MNPAVRTVEYHFTLISQVALGAFIPLAIGCFFVVRPQLAALLVILGGDMFLPEVVDFKLPLLPQFDKWNLPYLCVLIGCLLTRPRRILKSPQERWFTVLTLALVVGAVCTGLTNHDPAFRAYLPPIKGLTAKDGFYMAALNLTRVSVPFFIGCTLFRKPKDFRDLLAGFVVAAVIYAPLALFEVRMSPQLHLWVYGYFQHAFDQTKRWGGFRPMVFMSHGLSLARFFVVAIFAAFMLGRAKKVVLGMPVSLIGWGLVVVLLLGKSTGAILFVAAGLPLLLFGKSKLHSRIAFALAAFVFLYPLLRTWEVLPTDSILGVSRSLVGSDRSESLEFRFNNENVLLARARERFVFGWGQYARNFVFNSDGKSAIADGYWVIQMGINGMVGFVASFGTLLIPIFLARRRLRLIIADADRKLVGGTALTLAVVALDWIPNGLWAPYPYMLAGALAGVTREIIAAQQTRRTSDEMQAYTMSGPINVGAGSPGSPAAPGWNPREVT
jgi:hypothetical protein